MMGGTLVVNGLSGYQTWFGKMFVYRKTVLGKKCEGWTNSVNCYVKTQNN